MARLSALLVTLSVVLSLADTPTAVPTPAPAADCELSWSGPYRNLWGFEVAIPAGRKAYSDSPVSGCGDQMWVIGDHGIVIPLSTEPYEEGRQMGISSGYNSAEVSSVGEAANDVVQSVGKRAVTGTIRVVRRTRVSLAGLHGIRVAVRYRDRRTDRDMVNDSLEFLRPARTRRQPLAEYYVHVHLLTPQTHYAQDRREFEMFLASVRFSDPQK